MPEGIVESVKDVQEHGTDVSGSRPVGWDEIGRFDRGTSVCPRKGVATAPDNHGHHEEEAQCESSAHRAPEIRAIETISHEQRTGDLSEIVQERVEGLGAGVEVSAVDGVLLVCVEPVGRPEHGEQENDVWLEFDRFPETDELGLPGRVLLEDNVRSVWSDDV